MLILRQSRVDSTVQRSPYDHNSETTRLTEEITYLRNENRFKSNVMQTLPENENTQQRSEAPNKSNFKVLNNYERS